MIDQLLEQLRASVVASSTLPEETKADLLAHIQAMEADLKTAPDSVGPGNRGEPHGLARLRTAVEDLEASHPELTSLVSRVATHLSNLGI